MDIAASISIARTCTDDPVDAYFKSNGERIASAVEAEIVSQSPKLLAKLFIGVLQSQSFNLSMNLERSLGEGLSAAVANLKG